MEGMKGMQANNTTDTFIFLVMVSIVMVGIAVVARIALDDPQPSPTAFERQHSYIQECLASEQYTRDECIQMSIVEIDAQ